MSTIVEEKKRNKRDRLLHAALGLFLEKGPAATSIDEIVQSAGVAKGTFYLYFKDRNEILARIVAGESVKLMRQAFVRARLRHPADVDEELLFAVEEALERFKESPELLSLIHKHSSWSLLAASEESSEEAHRDWKRLARGRPEAEFAKLSFIILELVTSVAYSSIVLGEPAGLEEMKPYLLKAVGRLLT